MSHHKLTILEEGGDWALANGDLKLTRDGDIFVGEDEAYNGMRRLVLAWSYGAPTMRLMFKSIDGLREEQTSLYEEMERAHLGANPFIPGRSEDDKKMHLQAYHVASEALSAGEIGRGVLAGCLMITVQSMLGRFRGDVKPTAADWNDAQPALNGISVGRLVAAAANAFRHADEWAEALATGKFTEQQRASMQALRAAVPPHEEISDERSWERALNAMSGGTLENLGAAVLTFAHDVALRVRGRPAGERHG